MVLTVLLGTILSASYSLKQSQIMYTFAIIVFTCRETGKQNVKLPELT